MSRSLSKFGRLGFLIVACCTPQVISFGDDGKPLPTPQVPTKTPPARHLACPPLGSVAVYQPNWYAGQTVTARVQYTNATDANNFLRATLYYSYYGTPTCYSASATSISVGGTYTVAWPMTSFKPNATALNASNLTDNWVTVTFKAVDPPGGTVSTDGTGTGIIIITQSDLSQYRVSNNMTLENVKP